MPGGMEGSVEQLTVPVNQEVKTVTSEPRSLLSRRFSRRSFLHLSALGGGALLGAAAGVSIPGSGGSALAAESAPTKSHVPEVTSAEEKPETDPNERVEQLIGINPQNYSFIDDRRYEGTVSIQPGENDPIIVHFGQTHRGDLLTSLRFEEEILTSQSAIIAMIRDSGIKDVFDEGFVHELVPFYQTVRNAKEKFDAIHADQHAWSRLYNIVFADIPEALLQHSQSDDDWRVEDASSASEYLMMGTISRLVDELQSSPPHFQNDTEKKEFERFQQHFLPFQESDAYYNNLRVVLGPSKQLYLNGDVNLHAAEFSGANNAPFSIMHTIQQTRERLNEPDLSDISKRLLNEEVSRLERLRKLAVYDYREDVALRQIKQSSVLKPGAHVALVYGSLHDFSSEVQEIYPHGGAGLITIKPSEPLLPEEQPK